MATMRGVRTACRNCQKAFKYSTERLQIQRIGIRYSQKCLFVTSAALGLTLCEAKQKLDLQAPDEARLRQGDVLKAAAANAADTVTTLLSQTAFSLIETQQRYRGTILTLMQLLEHHVAVLGHAEEEERVMNVIAEARGWLQAYQKHIQEMEEFLSSVQQLADVSAEVAFLAGSELTSTSLGEHVYQLTRHIDSARQERQQTEAQLQEVENSCLEARAKRTEREERRKKAEDTMFGGDLLQGGEEEEEKVSEKDVFGERITDTAQTEEHAKENLEQTF